ncbi:uncharacterized protein LOC129733833 [Wyeomyia smithii]|uniref:uncharacterized protein LOC129733833 n=1 Tax=Wyeomyia smithii TaxID=174621 RepID=UPI0024681980|nr:uncharacterized protein LOC129733833 [Wyeomyia smithii]
MSFANRNFLSFFMFRLTTAGSLTEAGTGPNRIEQQSLFPTMNDDGKDISVICFERLATVWASWVQLTASMILTVTGLIYAFHRCYGSDNECAAYYTMLHLRAFFWFLIYIIHLYVKSRHNRLKILGYHEFLQQTHHHKKAALKLVSLVNLFVLTLHTALLQVLGVDFFKDCKISGFSATVFINVVCAAECILLMFLHVTYSVEVDVFNTIQSPPDALLDQDQPGGGVRSMNPDEFIGQQFLLIVKLLDDNRHLQDKIREFRSMAHLINSESTHLSLAEQSLIGY